MWVAQTLLRQISTNFYGHLDTSHNWDCMRILMDCVPLYNHHIMGLFYESMCRWISSLISEGVQVVIGIPYNASTGENHSGFHSCRNTIPEKLTCFPHHKLHSCIPKWLIFGYCHHMLFNRGVYLHIDSFFGCYIWTKFDSHYCCCIESLHYLRVQCYCFLIPSVTEIISLTS